MKPFVSLFLLLVSLLALITVLVAWRMASACPTVVNPSTGKSLHSPLAIKNVERAGRLYSITATETKFCFHNLPPDYFTTFDRLRNPHQEAGFVSLNNGFLRVTYFDGTTSWHVFVSCWLVLLIAAISPIRWMTLVVSYGWRNREQQRRIRLGQCPRCGYDLTANSSGICPECGKNIESATA